MNDRLLTTINGWSGNQALDAAMTVVAKDLIFAVFLVLAVLGLQRLRRREWRPLVFSAMGLALAFGLGLLAAVLYPERRPFQTHHLHVVVAHAAGQSFPSDHATAAFAIALAVFVFQSRAWGWLLLSAAVLIGFARVYDGIHYPGDILGSVVVAVVGVGLAAAVEVTTRTRSWSGGPRREAHLSA
jgi:undecaprenyl-diphosphatase